MSVLMMIGGSGIMVWQAFLLRPAWWLFGVGLLVGFLGAIEFSDRRAGDDERDN